MGKKKSKVRGGAGRAGGAAAVSEAAIMDACLRGDLIKLQKLGRQSVRVTTADHLFRAAGLGLLDVMRCLVQELEADVHQEEAPACGTVPGHGARC